MATTEPPLRYISSNPNHLRARGRRPRSSRTDAGHARIEVAWRKGFTALCLPALEPIVLLADLGKALPSAQLRLSLDSLGFLPQVIESLPECR